MIKNNLIILLHKQVVKSRPFERFYDGKILGQGGSKEFLLKSLIL